MRVVVKGVASCEEGNGGCEGESESGPESREVSVDGGEKSTRM